LVRALNAAGNVLRDAVYGYEIQLYLIDHDTSGTTDPDKLLRGGHKQGDVIEIFGPSKILQAVAPWWILRVIDIPKFAAAKYLKPQMTGETTIRRKLFGVVFSDLPSATQTALTNTRYAVIRWSQLRLAMKNKTNGNPEP
jgi:hypothetical protein